MFDLFLEFWFDNPWLFPAVLVSLCIGTAVYIYTRGQEGTGIAPGVMAGQEQWAVSAHAKQQEMLKKNDEIIARPAKQKEQERKDQERAAEAARIRRIQRINCREIGVELPEDPPV